MYSLLRTLLTIIDHNDAIKTVHVQIPDDYKLASFDVKSLALECTGTAIKNFMTKLPMDLLNLCLMSSIHSLLLQALQTVTQNSYGLTSFHCCSRNCHVEHRGTSPSNLQMDTTALVMTRR